jgi:serine/threonine protein kinase
MNHQDNNTRFSAKPLPFPEPTMALGHFETLSIEVGEGDNVHMINSECLISDNTGHCYELMVQVKEAIYGSIWRTWLLKKNDVNVLQRTIPVAIKKICRQKLRVLQNDVRCCEDSMNEMSFMQELGNDHPNLMGQLECVSTDDYIFSIMRYANGGDLFDHIQKQPGGHLSETTARKYFNDILNGLEFMHKEHNTVHRDISAENIVLDEKGNCILMDYGQCLKLDIQPETNEQYLIPNLGWSGKHYYYSPEVFLYRTFDGIKNDVWQLGIVLYMMVTGLTPVISKKKPKRPTILLYDQRYKMIVNRDIVRILIHYGVSEDLRNLICQMLSMDFDHRPTIAEIRQHAWMTLNTKKN